MHTHADSWVRPLGSGLAGAVALTMIHEGARRELRHAPRMDVLGMRAIRRGMRWLGLRPFEGRELRAVAMAGDVLSNALYYSVVGRGAHAWRRGALLGAAAGVGAVVLPGVLGLGARPSRRTAATAAMTVGWYLAGGLVAAAASRLMAHASSERRGAAARAGQ